MQNIHIIGAGLAGCEAALFLANKGHKVQLFEQKPHKFSPAHTNENFAELVCSNSLKSMRIDSAAGLLKAEMQLMGSSLLKAAQHCKVAAGGALAVNRSEFANYVTQMCKENPNITVQRQEVTGIDVNDKNTIYFIASGPLTDGALAQQILKLTNCDNLAFYDAAAPIISADSINYDKVFAASRYGKGTADYLNCPFDKVSYEAFHNELANAQRAELHSFDNNENIKVYEGCMPIEIMAQRGADTMRYGPLRPVGLTNPKTGHRPWANIQLRAEDKNKSMYNIVGFQTNLKFSEQKRVFSMIPGLENANFVRYGVMHRNTFLNSPKVLNYNLSLKNYANVYFAGQITGFEGYMESAASGLVAALNVHKYIVGEKQIVFPATGMCGALLNYINSENENFQPMGANMGLLPPLNVQIKDKRVRYAQTSKRAIEDLAIALNKNIDILFDKEDIKEIFSQ